MILNGQITFKSLKHELCSQQNCSVAPLWNTYTQNYYHIGVLDGYKIGEVHK